MRVDLIEYLRGYDEETRDERAERLDFVISEFGEPRHLLLHGGPITRYALDEMKQCFVDGQFIACVLTAQIFLEQLLGRMLHLAGKKPKGSGFASLLQLAKEEGYISIDEYDLFVELKNRRNPYSHHRDISDTSTLMMRVIESHIDNPDNPKDEVMLMEEDARHAVSAVFTILKRKPFAFYDND